jgi:DNA adenine methylase
MIRFNKKNGFNVPYGHKPQRFSKSYITKIVNQVKHFEHKLKENDWMFVCQPFEDTIKLANDETFIYCDPPYIGRHVDYYDSWDEEREKKLHNALTNVRAKFMLSSWESSRYRYNPYIGKIWVDCYKITQEHFYFVGATEKNRNAVTEALLTNYPMNGSVVTNTLGCEQMAL